MKACPICKEQIQDEAIKCRYCQSFLISVQEPEKKEDSNRITYIIDRDLVRFAKFATAVLGVLLIVGAFLFGFELDNAVEKVRDTREKITKTQTDLAQAQKELQAAQITVNELKTNVEALLSEAKRHVTAMSEQRPQAVGVSPFTSSDNFSVHSCLKRSIIFALSSDF
ncbi:MAG: coiled-coil domain-containing protein [Desulfomonilaceae bacterium]